MSGVFIQAQMVSQILSAVLDGRPLLGVWNRWSEASWILGWSLVGGLLAWRLRNLVILVPVGVGVAGILFGLCRLLFIQGTWVPLVPSALGLVVTGAVVTALSHRVAFKANS